MSSRTRFIPKKGIVIPTFERYYNGALAASGTYTPAVSGLFHYGDSLVSSFGELLYSGATWLTAGYRGGYNDSPACFGDGTNYRIRNASASLVNNIVVMRAIVQHYSPSYTWSTITDLASGATSVVATAGLYSFAWQQVDCQVEYYSADVSAWIVAIRENDTYENPAGLFISDGTNARIENHDVSARDFALMRWS